MASNVDKYLKERKKRIEESNEKRVSSFSSPVDRYLAERANRKSARTQMDYATDWYGRSNRYLSGGTEDRAALDALLSEYQTASHAAANNRHLYDDYYSVEESLDSVYEALKERASAYSPPVMSESETAEKRIREKMDALKKETDYSYSQDRDSASFIDAGRSAMSAESPRMKAGGFLVTRPDKSTDIREYMDEDQRSEYLYRYGKEGKESADAFLSEISEDLKALRAQKTVEDAEAFARENPGAAYVGSTVTNLLGNFPAALYTAGQYLKGEDIDPYAEEYMLSRIGQTQRQTAIEQFEEVTDNDTLKTIIGWGANAIGSAIDSTSRRLLFGPAGAAIMATGAAADGVRSSVERGYSRGQALAVGSIAGALEYLTEMAGFERVTGAMEAGEGAVKTLVKSFVPEALEEGASAFGNAVADTLIGMEKSELMELVSAYKAEGMDDKEAWKKALTDTAKSIGEEMLIGGISGGLMGGGAAAIGNASRNAAYRSAGRDITASGNRAAIVELARNLEESIPAQQTAMGMDAETASARDIGRLYYDTQRGLYDNAIRSRASDLGIPLEDSEIMAMAIDKVLQGEDLSRSEKRAYEGSAEAQRIVSEYQHRNDPIYTADWARGLGATQDAVASMRGKRWTEADRSIVGEAEEPLEVPEAQETNLEQEAKAQKIPEEAMDVLRQVHEASGKPSDTRQMVSDFKLSYFAGRNGVDAASLSIPESGVTRVAHSAGVAAADKAEGSSFKTGANVQYTAAALNRAAVQMAVSQTGKSRAKDVAKAKTHIKQQIALIGSFAKKYDRRVIFENSIDVTGNDGKVRKSAANAYIDASGDIHIALDATNQAYTFFAFHELVHDIRKRSEEDYGILRDLVVETLEKNGQDFEALVKKQMDKFGYSRELAEEEVIANTVPAILSDEETVRRMAETNRGFLERIGEWIRDFIKNLEAAFNRLSKSESFEQMEALKGDIQSLKNIRDALFDALEATKGMDTENSTVLRYSTKETGMSEERKAEYDEYVLNALKGPGNNKKPTFEILPKVKKELIDFLRSNGEDVSYSASHNISDNDIRHIRNRHGIEKEGEYGVTIGDLQAIPYIINNAERIYHYVRKDGKRGILYALDHVDTTFYVEQIQSEKVFSGKQMVKSPLGKIPEIYEDIIQKEKALTPSLDVQSNQLEKTAPEVYVQDVPEPSAYKKIITDRELSVNPSDEKEQKFSMKDEDIDPALVSDVLSAYPEMDRVLEALKTQEVTTAGRNMAKVQIDRRVKRWLRANEVRADYDAQALVNEMDALFKDFYMDKKMTVEAFAEKGAGHEQGS